MLGGLGPTELIIIFLIVLLLFGAKKIPEIARGLGKGIKEFKDSQSEASSLEGESSSQKKIDEDPVTKKDS